MRNKKGFTLVELLAVILILTSVSLIAVSGISASLEKRDVRECEEQKELAVSAAKIYFSLKDEISVTVGTLKSGGYFNVNNKTDRLRDESTITKGDTTYTFNGECES